jgi:hypothetical protein
MDPALRELLALAALSAFGCGLALAHADFYSWPFLLLQAQRSLSRRCNASGEIIGLLPVAHRAAWITIPKARYAERIARSPTYA